MDTDIAIEALRGNQLVCDQLKKYAYHALSWVVFGELLLGASKSANPEKQLADIEEFREEVGLLLPTEETSYVYASVGGKLEKIGKPIPQNDLWIASVAVQYRLPLASNDKHFDSIENLEVIRLR